MATPEPDKPATGGIVSNPPTVGEAGCSLALPTRTTDLAAIAARADAATPGPWRHSAESLERYVLSDDDTLGISFGCKDPRTVADAEFVAHAREDVPALLALVTDLENRLRLAHQARRAKEHQLDDIRRALCDAGFMRDDDPYSHADLADVIRQVGEANREAGEAQATASTPEMTEDIGREAEEFKADYLGACETIAAMHAAATGRTGQGPVRGVVEDVADVRTELEQAEAALDRVRDAALLVRQGVLSLQELYAVIGPASEAAPAPAATGIRGLLEHVGIDCTGRDIVVDGEVVDPAPAATEHVHRPRSATTPCTACGHSRAWHGPGPCHAPDGRCECPKYQPPADATPSAATEATEPADRTAEQQPTTDAIAAELHRRNQRLSELASDPSTCNSEAWACVRGEVLGLQVALGITLGHPATGDEGLKAARAYYIQWLGQATAEPREPRPPSVGR